MELLASGNVKMEEFDLELMRASGYVVSMHTPQYVNCIAVYLPNGTSVGFHNWIDNLDFYIDDERIQIKNEAHLEACFAMMNAINIFNSMRVE